MVTSTRPSPERLRRTTGPAELVVVEALGTGYGLTLVRRAVESGVRTAFVTESTARYVDDLDAVLLADPPPGLAVLTGVTTTDAAAIGTAISTVGTRRCGVLAQVDRTIAPTAAACARIDRAFAAPEVIRTCRDKDALRLRLDGLGLPSVAWAVAADPGQLAAATRQMTRTGAPVVVKPARGTASEAVRLCATAADAFAAGTAILAAGGRVLLEEYVPGPVLSVEMFRYRGRSLILGLTDRVLSDPPHFAELGWTFPLELPDAQAAEVTAAADAILSGIGFDDGPAHVEFALGPDGPRLIEVNPRMAGRGISHMVSTLSGYDAYDLVIGSALGRDLPPAGPRPGGYLSDQVITAPIDLPMSAAFAGAAAGLPGVVGVRLATGTRSAQTFGGRRDVGEVRGRGPTAAYAQMCARAGAQAVMAAIAAAATPGDPTPDKDER